MSEAQEYDMAGELIPFPERPVEVRDAAELVEHPDAEVEPGGELVEGEIVDEPTYVGRIIDTRPVLPAWLIDRQERIEAARWAARYARHRTSYHGARVPLYLVRLALAAPRGLWRALLGWGRWVADAEGHPLRQAAIMAGDSATYMSLSRQRNERVKFRAKLSAVVAVLLAVAAVVASFLLPVALWLAVALVALVCGIWGRRADRPIVTPATVVQQASRLTPDVVLRAFLAAKLATEATPVTFAQPIQRDGKGWLAVVDLPYGKTFTQAAKARDALASGLNVNAVTTFLDPDTVSARRVRLWVSDVDVFAQAAVTSPLARARSFDLWQPIPFGLDARDRLITLPLVFSSLLVGAIPRMGKTFAARIPAAAAALDPHVRLYVFDGKGGRDWRAFEAVAHVFGAGIRDEIVELLVDSLRALVADMNARYERMSSLPSDVCPESKLTPALARNRRLSMPLTVVAVDEVQRYLEHPQHGAEVLALLTDLAKVGPAAGIMLALATQKPDSKVLPDSLRGQIGTRFALRVMTWQASETILGAGTYPAGMDASKFLSRHKGVGILLGADDGELAERGGQTVRTHLLSGAALDELCARGRALREDAGTLSGMAAGEVVAAARPTRVLDDLAAVFAPGEDRAWSEVLVARLAEADPGAYSGWSANQLATALKPYDVSPVQVWATGEDGKGANRRGYLRDAITDALAGRLDNP